MRSSSLAECTVSSRQSYTDFKSCKTHYYYSYLTGANVVDAFDHPVASTQFVDCPSRGHRTTFEEMLASSSRAFSPPHSTVSSAQGPSSPVQIKKVVVEGRSKHDGASLRMYIKVCSRPSILRATPIVWIAVCLYRQYPAWCINTPLCRRVQRLFSRIHEIYQSDSPENKIRITQSKVHPLDERSVPYHFSATEQPLLQKTAIALQLGPKSSRSYHTLFSRLSPSLDPTISTGSRRGREGHLSNSVPPQNDERYTGYILVSGYNITLVLPKEFPPKPQITLTGAESDGDEGFAKDVQSPWLSRSAKRSSSFFHKNYLHMMAGIELFIPYVLTPPKGPFLVCSFFDR